MKKKKIRFHLSNVPAPLLDPSKIPSGKYVVIRKAPAIGFSCAVGIIIPEYTQEDYMNRYKKKK